ncbi:MAG: serine--tRNA ligase, partial [Clostridia bacterium]|nr:serine--tRNA ligase [Clostridia bacterium]
MLDIKLIIENPELVKARLLKKGYDVDFTEIIEKDAKKRALQFEIESLKAQRNKASSEIPALKKQGLPVEHIFQKMREIGDEISKGDAKINELSQEIFDFIACLPNMPDDDLLPGEKENNKVVKEYNSKPTFDFKAKNHVDLCTNLGIIDYERGVKLSGNGFWAYRKDGARLEWALLNFFIQEHLNDGYEFILPPHQLSYNCGFGAGQFPKFSDEVYWLDVDEDRRKNRFMLPTAETALVNLYANEIIDEDKLPFKFFAFTPCYRKEAGSARAEERGMIRGHQFNKVEMVQITTSDTSDIAFDELVDKACSLMDKLG